MREREGGGEWQGGERGRRARGREGEGEGDPRTLNRCWMTHAALSSLAFLSCSALFRCISSSCWVLRRCCSFLCSVAASLSALRTTKPRNWFWSFTADRICIRARAAESRRLFLSEACRPTRAKRRARRLRYLQRVFHSEARGQGGFQEGWRKAGGRLGEGWRPCVVLLLDDDHGVDQLAVAKPCGQVSQQGTIALTAVQHHLANTRQRGPASRKARGRLEEGSRQVPGRFEAKVRGGWPRTSAC